MLERFFRLVTLGCKVVRVEALHLWESYSFFVRYARCSHSLGQKSGRVALKFVDISVYFVPVLAHLSQMFHQFDLAIE